MAALSASNYQQAPTLTPDQMNSLRSGITAGMAKYNATGSFTNQTPAQNLAAVLKQPGNAQINNPANQATLLQAAKDTAAQQNTSSGFSPVGKLNSTQPNQTQVQQLQQAQPQQQGNNNADLINSMYNQNYASQLQKLQEARQIQQQGLNQQETGVNQNALQNLNNNDSLAAQQLKQLQEVQANNGVKGGDSITATIGNQTAQQNGANSINQDRANQLNDIQQKRSLINNNASANDLALMQQLQATRSGQLIDNNNTQDQRAIQLAQLMGTYNGQKTLGGQQQALAAQGQQFNQGIAQAGLTGQYNGQQTQQAQNQQFNQTQQINAVAYQTARDGIMDKRYQDTFDNNVKQQGFENALKTALQAHQISNDNYQLAISKQNANTNTDNSKASISNMNADNTRQDNAVKLTADQNDYTSKVYNELSQLDPADAASYLNKNAADIVHNLGQKGFDALKTSATSGQTTQDKTALDVRDKAIAAAQKDVNWPSMTIDQQKALIQQYQTLYQ